MDATARRLKFLTGLQLAAEEWHQSQPLPAMITKKRKLHEATVNNVTSYRTIINYPMQYDELHAAFVSLPSCILHDSVDGFYSRQLQDATCINGYVA
eukprot:s286_g6.t1